jgi:hypothetical protein
MSSLKGILSKKTKIKKVKVSIARHDTHYSRWHLILFALIFGAIGTYIIVRSFAATTLISEDFSTNASNFTVQKGGVWGVANGKYNLTSPSTVTSVNNSNVSVHNTVVNGDYTLTTNANSVSTSSAWDDFSVVFDFKDANNYFYANFNESEGPSTNGLFKVVNGTSTQVSDFSSLITGGTVYAVKVEKVGATVKVYRSGTLMATITDSLLTGGRVGFGAYNNSAVFDDLVVSIPSVGSTTSTTTLNPTADAFVDAGNASTNYGTYTSLQVDTEPLQKSFMKFDLSSLAGKSVSSAKLRIYINNASADTQNIKSVADNAWTETGLTYNNQPVMGSKIASVSGTTLSTWKEIDITSYVSSKAGQIASLGMDGNGPNGDSVRFDTKEAANKPQLIVTTISSTTTTPPPPAPPPAPEACGDGQDNDADGKVDYPNDPGCTSLSDTDEYNAAAPPPPNTCSVTISPGANVATAFNALSAGQTLCLRTGTYGGPTVTTRLDKSGTSGSPITLTTVPGEAPATIEGEFNVGSNSSTGMRSNITVSRLNFKMNKTDNGRVNASKGCTTTRVSGVILNGSNITFEYNDVSEASAPPQYRDTAIGVNYGARGSNIVIRFNKIHEYGACLQYDHGIYFDHVDNGKVYGNWIWNPGCAYGTGTDPSKGCGSGIQLWNDPSGTQVFSNVIDGAGIGFYIAGSGSNNNVYNNVITNLRGMYNDSKSFVSPVGYNGYAGNSSNKFTNNIYFNAGSMCSTCTATSSGNITSDPLFTNPLARDYTLKSGSPASGYGLWNGVR